MVSREERDSNVVGSFAELARLHGIPIENGQEAEPKRSGASIIAAGLFLGQEILDSYATRPNAAVETPRRNQTILSSTSQNPELVAEARVLGRELYYQTRRSLNVGDYAGELKQLLVQVNSELKPKFRSCFEVEFPLPICPGLPELEVGYGFKGGSARLALLKALGEGEHALPRRDIDLLRIGTGWTAKDIELSKLHMAEDFGFNPKHGVEISSNLRHNIRTRDTTVNEVVYLDGVVTASMQCLCDSIGGVIRPTNHHRVNAKHGIRGMVAAKMLRFLSEGLADGRDMHLEHFVPSHRYRAGAFEVALHLKRALEYSACAAEIYLAACSRTRLAPDLSLGETVEDAVQFLGSQIRQGTEFFDLPLPD